MINSRDEFNIVVENTLLALSSATQVHHLTPIWINGSTNVSNLYSITFDEYIPDNTGNLIIF